MDRNNRRVKYLTGANTTFKAYGMNDEKKKKNKKKNTVQGSHPNRDSGAAPYRSARLVASPTR